MVAVSNERRAQFDPRVQLFRGCERISDASSPGLDQPRALGDGNLAHFGLRLVFNRPSATGPGPGHSARRGPGGTIPRARLRGTSDSWYAPAQTFALPQPQQCGAVVGETARQFARKSRVILPPDPGFNRPLRNQQATLHVGMIPSVFRFCSSGSAFVVFSLLDQSLAEESDTAAILGTQLERQPKLLFPLPENSRSAWRSFRVRSRGSGSSG